MVYIKSDDDYQGKLQEQLESVLDMYDLMIGNLKLSIHQLSSNVLFDSIEQICQLKMKSNRIQEEIHQIEEKLTNNSDVDLDQYKILKNKIKYLRKSINQLKLQTHIDTLNQKQNNQIEEISLLNYLRVRQLSPAILDLSEDELDLTRIDNEKRLDEFRDVPIVEFISADKNGEIKQQVRLANNFVVLMKGPVKSIVNGAMHMTEALAKSHRVSDIVIEAVEKGLIRQEEVLKDNHINSNDPVNCAFVEVTSDWIYEGENVDKGFSNDSIWMRNPDGEKILVKSQDLLICAANEWLAYAIGKELGLPINKVQIGIYEKNLITLHFDVNHGNEQTFTLNQLPKRLRQRLMHDPIIGAMDLFDRLVQNVDRNPLNILITMPNSETIDDDTTKLKIHFIDHGACFGMGKRSGLSVFASKLRTNHISVAKFHPVHESHKFDRYLSKLSPQDRILLGRIINRLAAITNQQIDQWLSVVENLLTSTQYNRIHSVLHYQRDIAKRYVIQWGIYQTTPENHHTLDYF